jgi:formate-nitrite transporter family protein
MLNPAQSSTLGAPVSEGRDHIRGLPTAPVTLVEYGDFECPHCRAAHVVLDNLFARIGDRFRLVFRHFPLTQIHPHAERAAEAAEAAGTQRRFWDMHDLLFDGQDALEDDDLAAYASELGLDVERFALELVEGTHRPRVREDFVSGVRSGVNGTPSFFINGRRHDGSWDEDTLAAAIVTEARSSLAAAGRRGRAGIDRPYA